MIKDKQVVENQSSLFREIFKHYQDMNFSRLFYTFNCNVGLLPGSNLKITWKLQNTEVNVSSQSSEEKKPSKNICCLNF